jgi:hypothetical protein
MAMKHLGHVRWRMVEQPLLSGSQTVLALASLVDKSRPAARHRHLTATPWD